MECCRPNCFECPFEDCSYEGKDTSDIDLSDIDAEIAYRKAVSAGTDRFYRYRHSENGQKKHSEYMREYRAKPEYKEQRKEHDKKYQQSQRGKCTAQKRRNSDKRKAYMQEYMKKYMQTEEYKQKHREANRRYELKKCMALAEQQ